ncbi:MAG: BREX-3 system P-loop-containing protein BrxF [Bacillota bacterium]
MNYSSLKSELQQMDHWWHKLIFLCNINHELNTKIPIIDKCSKLNVNYILSEKLLNISKNKYPLYVEEILLNEFVDESEVYFLQHIDILFDPVLQVHPIRLLENISKKYKLVIDWPGRYEDNRLYYAEYGHPEYFSCHDYEGKVILK